jgi:hypothetical protein
VDDFGVWGYQFDFQMGACAVTTLGEFGSDSSWLSFFFGSSNAKGAGSIFLISVGC